MTGINKYPIVKPSDAVAWVECARRVWLDNKGQHDHGKAEDAFQQLVIERGMEHERHVLELLTEQYDVHEARSVEHTQQLMVLGAEVIYQAQLRNEDEGFIGFPDFLIRSESGEYQPADAKLSLSEDKKSTQVQLGFYRRLLGGELPAIVFLGDGSTAEIGNKANAITSKFIIDMRSLLADEREPSARYSHSKCRACAYYGHCKPQFEAREELSLLYGIQGRTAEGLEKAEIGSIAALANSDPETLPDVPYLKGLVKKQRAVLQAQSYLDGSVHKVAPIILPQGTWVHFDIEDNPISTSGGKHVYLWGFLVTPVGKDNFEYIWTDKEDEDEKGWIAFLDKVEKYRSLYSDLVLAHFSPHERSTIRSYAKRYGMEENETVLYLLGDDSPLFDMQKPVLESLVLPLQGYGLKDICKHPKLVNFQWEDDSSGSQWSIVQFNQFLQETDESSKQKLKQEILGYNRDDVIATQRLEEWLRDLLDEE